MTTTQPSPDGADTTVFDPSEAPTEIVVGDLTSTGEHPLFEQPPSETLSVVVNVSYARLENGTRAVRVLDRGGRVVLQLSAAQAHQLALDLQESADIVGTIRQQAGFTS